MDVLILLEELTSLAITKTFWGKMKCNIGSMMNNCDVAEKGMKTIRMSSYHILNILDTDHIIQCIQ